MRRRLAIALPLLLLVACGDDGKVGSTAPPKDAAATPPPRPPDAAPPASADASPSWSGTRAGDWATWTVVPEGGGTTTRLTWRATKVDAGHVSFTVESTTTDAAGAVVATTRTDEVHDLEGDVTATSPVPVRGSARGEDVRVGAVAVPTTVRVLATARGDVQTWTSTSVPFTGLVRAKGAGVDQSLEGFGRGR